MTIEANAGTPRTAPPALLVAMAVGLGSVDMPVPAIAEWEWLNWTFPRAVHAGDTIYARWMLTQKRPPVGGAPTSIVVWRVDLHTSDGALCAEGEIGAKVRRLAPAIRQPGPADAAAPPASGTRSRRRRRPRANGTLPEPPPVAAPPAAAAKPERASGPSRRRRRRRSGGSGGREEDHEPRAAHAPDTDAPPPMGAAAPPSNSVGTAEEKGTISRVLKRLRRS